MCPHHIWAPEILTCKEGQELTSGPFNPKGQGDGGEFLDTIEAKLMKGQAKEERTLEILDPQESQSSETIRSIPRLTHCYSWRFSMINSNSKIQPSNSVFLKKIFTNSNGSNGSQNLSRVFPSLV